MQLIFSRDTWELLSFVVTVIGLPLAIVVFIYEQRKERDNEEEEVYQLLSDNYQDFLKVALANPDLGLFSPGLTPALSEQQKERMVIIFSMLVSLFERAFLLLYEENLSPKQLRRWHSWEDYMREWCQRADGERDSKKLARRFTRPQISGYLRQLHATSAESRAPERHPPAMPKRS